jgi:hypothetical protein
MIVGVLVEVFALQIDSAEAQLEAEQTTSDFGQVQGKTLRCWFVTRWDAVEDR